MSDLTCGEATIGLLKAYGVDTVFGIPGVHTLEFYRGLDRFGLRRQWIAATKIAYRLLLIRFQDGSLMMGRQKTIAE